MRLLISLSPNKSPVNWGYLPALVGLIHDRIGFEAFKVHDQVSLYSLSMLSPGRMQNGGLSYPEGAFFCFSAHNPVLVYSLFEGLQKKPDWRYGMYATHGELIQIPALTANEMQLQALSPILVRRDLPEGKQEHLTFEHPDSDQMLTDIWKLKLRHAGLPDENVSLEFDRSYTGAKTKLIDYRGIKNKCSFCPVIARFQYPAQGEFLINVGAGESTGSGFGALAF